MGYLAHTVDPLDIQSGAQRTESFILFNDGGFDEPNGFWTDPTTQLPYDPFTVDGMNVLEHEFTHFLARFKNRWFVETRFYDAGEHKTPHNMNNILKPKLPYPLIIPGSAQDPATEKGEIWIRINNGQWDDP